VIINQDLLHYNTTKDILRETFIEWVYWAIWIKSPAT